MGLSVVSAGFELRKNYLLRQGGESVYSKIDFANSAWGLEEQIDSLEGMICESSTKGQRQRTLPLCLRSRKTQRKRVLSEQQKL